MLFIYTKKPNNYFSVEFLKEIGRFIFRKSRGPQAVIDSLTRGLSDIGQTFYLNKTNPKLDGSQVFFVNNSLDALEWAISLKKRGKIKKIIAGPNMVISVPSDANGIILSPEIDIIILPSDWVKRFWVLVGFENIKNIIIWPAGTKDYGSASNQIKQKALIYKKNIPEKIYFDVKNVVSSFKNNYEEIFYGKFSRNDYFKKLDNIGYMVYLQESESQGLSLLEAWMKNIPTFVYSSGSIKKGDFVITGNDVAAPYLNEKCGAFFSTPEELKIIIFNYLNGTTSYSSREYYLSNFTDAICAQKLLDVINK